MKAFVNKMRTNYIIDFKMEGSVHTNVVRTDFLFICVTYEIKIGISVKVLVSYFDSSSTTLCSLKIAIFVQ